MTHQMSLAALLFLLLGCSSSDDAAGPNDDGFGEEGCTSGCGSWSDAAPMPTARWGVGAASLGGLIYVVGGRPLVDDTVDAGLTTLEVYDPLTNSWSPGADLPEGLNEPAVAVLDGRLFVIGGCCGPSTANFQYDPVTDQWVARASAPRARHGAAAGTLGGKIYVVGGQTGNNALSWVDVYDPATNTWIAAATDLIVPRADVSVAVVDGFLYAIGGAVPEGGVQDLERYDPDLDQWSMRGRMRFLRGIVAAGVIDGHIYAAGPGEGEGAATAVYDPSIDLWTRLADPPSFRTGAKGAAADGRLFVFGGIGSDEEVLDRVEVFTPGG